MNTLPLTIGLSASPITQALFDGSVRPNGIDLKLQTRFGDGLDNVGARHREIIAGKIDGGELSISSYILARLRGAPLVALPVFLSRRFRLRCMYCRGDSPLQHPSELAGKKATVHRYNATTPVWLKGILQNEFGVEPRDVDWYVAEPDIAEESLRHLRPMCESILFLRQEPASMRWIWSSEAKSTPRWNLMRSTPSRTCAI